MTGGRGTFILGLEGEAQFYWDWKERYIYTETGGRGNVIMGLEGEE